MYEPSILFCFADMQRYFFTYHLHFLQSLNIILSYNVLPCPLGCSILNSFLYSLIFSYCAICLKKNTYPNKYFIFFLLPFCFPWVLILNQLPIRPILCSWIFIYVSFFLYFHTNKKINNSISVLFFSFFSACLVSIRSEFIILLIFLPLFIFFYKVFSIRNLCLFIFVFYSIFCCFTLIQRKSESYYYELHNLAYIYEEYLVNNMYDFDLEEKSYFLKKIYAYDITIGELPTNSYNYDMSNEKEVLFSIYTLIKFALKNSFYFIKKNLIYFCDMGKEIFQFTFLEKICRESYSHNVPIPNFLIQKNLLKHKIASLFFYFNLDNKANIISTFIYSPMVSLLLLFVSMIIGLFINKVFYVLNFIVWLFIIYLLLVFMPLNVPFYFHSFIFNSCLMFVLSIISLLEHKNKNRE